MTQANCHFIGCDSVVTLTGDGASISQMIGAGEDRRRVFFCSEEHRQEFVRDGQAVRPESFAGYGPGVFSRAGTGT